MTQLVSGSTGVPTTANTQLSTLKMKPCPGQAPWDCVKRDLGLESTSSHQPSLEGSSQELSTSLGLGTCAWQTILKFHSLHARLGLVIPFLQTATYCSAKKKGTRELGTLSNLHIPSSPGLPPERRQPVSKRLLQTSCQPRSCRTGKALSPAQGFE